MTQFTDYMDCEEIAKRLNRSGSTVANMIRNGKIPGAKRLDNSNKWIVPREAGEAFIASYQPGVRAPRGSRWNDGVDRPVKPVNVPIVFRPLAEAEYRPAPPAPADGHGWSKTGDDGRYGGW